MMVTHASPILLTYCSCRIRALPGWNISTIRDVVNLKQCTGMEVSVSSSAHSMTRRAGVGASSFRVISSMIRLLISFLRSRILALCLSTRHPASRL